MSIRQFCHWVVINLLSIRPTQLHIISTIPLPDQLCIELHMGDVIKWLAQTLAEYKTNALIVSIVAVC